MSDVVIWALPDGASWRIGTSDARYAPLPFAAEVICRVPRCDSASMCRWIERRIRRGWSIEKIKAAC